MTRRPQFEAAWQRRFIARGERQEDDASIAGWSENGLQTRLRHFQYWHDGAQAGSIWLDVGCGAGTYARLLANEGAHVIGIDYSQPSLVKANRKGPEVAGWVAGDAAQLPLQPECADCILCFGVLQALDDPGPALRELTSMLVPGGTLWVDALNRQCLPHRIRALMGKHANLRYDTVQALTDELGAIGLEPETLWVPILPARLKRLQPIMELEGTRWLLRRLPTLGALLSHSLLIAARKKTRPEHPDADADAKQKPARTN